MFNEGGGGVEFVICKPKKARRRGRDWIVRGTDLQSEDLPDRCFKVAMAGCYATFLSALITRIVACWTVVTGTTLMECLSPISSNVCKASLSFTN